MTPGFHTVAKSAEAELSCLIRIEAIKQCANAKLSAYSRINAVIEQTEPFEKTPTKKIKRYLYVQPVE